MEYIVLGKDGKEYGPVDADTLQLWVEHGRVLKDTQVRNALMKKWNPAGSIDILQEAFKVYHENEQAEAGISGKLKGALFGQKQEKEPKKEEVNTAFKQKYIPNPASVTQRIGAFIFDSIILASVGIVLFIMMNIYAGTLGLGNFSLPKSSSAEENVAMKVDGVAMENVDDKSGVEESFDLLAEEGAYSDVPADVKANIPKLKNVFYKFFAIFVAIVLLYYGIGLGLFAQTLGMHYWGIFLVKDYNDEAFAARGFAFALAMFALGILSPVFVLLNPQHRSIHGYITGTRLIRIAAKPKV